MNSAKQKAKDMASAAKEHAENYQAKVEEKMEKATARTKEEKQIAEERRKIKEAEAKMHLHEAKLEHAAEKLHGKHSHHLYGQPGGVPVVGSAHTHQPLVGGAAANVPGTTAFPTYPAPGAGQYPTGHHHHY